jgi:catechol 2,3-dioxygenase-like lactoylglutathione lyase family enzyme
MHQLFAPIPVLRSFDEAKARAFYVEFLGFAVDWEHRFEPGMPLYMQVSRDACVLHLSEHAGDAAPGACLFLPMADVRAYQALLRAKHDPHATPEVIDQPWGWAELHLTDPFGNKLRFAERRREDG